MFSGGYNEPAAWSTSVNLIFFHFILYCFYSKSSYSRIAGLADLRRSIQGISRSGRRCNLRRHFQLVRHVGGRFRQCQWRHHQRSRRGPGDSGDTPQTSQRRKGTVDPLRLEHQQSKESSETFSQYGREQRWFGREGLPGADQTPGSCGMYIEYCINVDCP